MSNEILSIPVTELVPHPENVRSTLGDLRTLTNSIASQGVLEPLLVRSMPSGEADTWQVIAGHRRLAAAKEAEDHIRLTEGDFDPMKTEDIVREKSLTWRISFLAAAQMFERSTDELVTPLLDEYAPFDESEL